jgi:hypothetical protein
MWSALRLGRFCAFRSSRNGCRPALYDREELLVGVMPGATGLTVRRCRQLAVWQPLHLASLVRLSFEIAVPLASKQTIGAVHRHLRLDSAPGA